MHEDDNLETLRRNSIYFSRRAQIGNMGNNASYFPQTCERQTYPGSFTDGGLYMYGAVVENPLPNWDITDAQPINWNKPVDYYSTPEQFHREFYKNNTNIYNVHGFTPRSQPPCNSGGYRTPTGWRKPSIKTKQIWLSEEKYANDY